MNVPAKFVSLLHLVSYLDELKPSCPIDAFFSHSGDLVT